MQTLQTLINKRWREANNQIIRQGFCNCVASAIYFPEGETLDYFCHMLILHHFSPGETTHTHRKRGSDIETSNVYVKNITTKNFLRISIYMDEYVSWRTRDEDWFRALNQLRETLF